MFFHPYNDWKISIKKPFGALKVATFA